MRPQIIPDSDAVRKRGSGRLTATVGFRFTCKVWRVLKAHLCLQRGEETVLKAGVIMPNRQDKAAAMKGLWTTPNAPGATAELASFRLFMRQVKISPAHMLWHSHLDQPSAVS